MRAPLAAGSAEVAQQRAARAAAIGPVLAAGASSDAANVLVRRNGMGRGTRAGVRGGPVPFHAWAAAEQASAEGGLGPWAHEGGGVDAGAPRGGMAARNACGRLGRWPHCRRPASIRC